MFKILNGYENIDSNIFLEIRQSKITSGLESCYANTGKNYEMGGTILSKTVKEKDLGVIMNANMKVSEQCRIAASKGNQIIGMIRRNIT